VTPEKIEQFDLLIQDHRSIRKLADAWNKEAPPKRG